MFSFCNAGLCCVVLCALSNNGASQPWLPWSSLFNSIPATCLLSKGYLPALCRPSRVSCVCTFFLLFCTLVLSLSVARVLGTSTSELAAPFWIKMANAVDYNYGCLEVSEWVRQTREWQAAWSGSCVCVFAKHNLANVYGINLTSLFTFPLCFSIDRHTQTQLPSQSQCLTTQTSTPSSQRVKK